MTHMIQPIMANKYFFLGQRFPSQLSRCTCYLYDYIKKGCFDFFDSLCVCILERFQVVSFLSLNELQVTYFDTGHIFGK